MRGLLAAVAFLTRVPVPVPVSGGDLARAVGWFPVVGAGVGLVVGAAAAGGARVLPPLVAATLAVALGLALTGALHEDGLADTVDALGAPRDRADAFRILTDSRLGTFGAAALILALVAKITTLAALPGATALLVAPAAAGLGRGAAVAVMWSVPPARPTGLGADHLRGLAGWRCATGIGAALALGAVLLGPALLPAAFGAALAAGLVTRWAVRRLGGVTGDALGAVAQSAELAVLVVLSAEAVRGWLPGG